MIERRAGDRKVAGPGLDSRTGKAWLSLGKDSLRFFPLGPSNLSAMVAQPGEKTCKQNQKKCSALMWLERAAACSYNEGI